MQESVDVYLTDLRRLAAAFGGLYSKVLRCAFVAGLPKTLMASSRMETTDVDEILQRVRAVFAVNVDTSREPGRKSAEGRRSMHKPFLRFMSEFAAICCPDNH